MKYLSSQKFRAAGVETLGKCAPALPGSNKEAGQPAIVGYSGP